MENFDPRGYGACLGPAARAVVLAGLAVAAQCAGAAKAVTENLVGREAVIYAPDHMPGVGARALVVVLHGGLGNADRIAAQRFESTINLNALADQGGFVVAYLNGTPITRLLGARRLGWNAGHCCGQPADNRVDDVAYIQAAVALIAERYGVHRSRIFGVGHSNGAMMTQRLLCETSLYAAAVSLSGTLENGATRCAGAAGRRLLAIHGADDQNVPIEGGRGSKSLSRTEFASQAATARVWQDSGAVYELHTIAGADHAVEAIDAQIRKTEGQSLGQKMAKFLGLRMSP